ncbi:MAG: histidine phosphatase family protein, partial [Prevotellaceae bacterium]|nr:histidine phosphatase family protein [Prevotellaceae bacterium]
MKTVLVIARHGNTFRRGETPRRVGGASDLPLVEEERGRNIGLYLKDKGLIPSAVYAAPLLRTVRTAELAVEAMGCKTEVIQLREFTEIDYGPDENKTEEEIELRLGDGDRDKGRAVIEAWNKNAAVPDGWRVNPSQIIETWLDFAENTVLRNGRNKTTL